MDGTDGAADIAEELPVLGREEGGVVLRCEETVALRRGVLGWMDGTVIGGRGNCSETS